MNEIIKIANAKVIKKGEFKTGVGDYGAWARINFKIEWQYSYVDENRQPQLGRMTLVVTAKGEDAIKVRDNVTEGNEYNNTPYTYVNVTGRLEGNLRSRSVESGARYEIVENTLVMTGFEIIGTQQNGNL